MRTDHNLTSRAAIKVISIPKDPDEIQSLQLDGMTADGTRTYLQGIVEDFVNEIQLMESLKGVQNIVSVEDYKVVERKDEIGWDIYIRMELLKPFNEWKGTRMLSENEVIRLGIDLCSALEICENNRSSTETSNLRTSSSMISVFQAGRFWYCAQAGSGPKQPVDQRYL